MIAKITRGAGFRGTLSYSLAPEHKPEIVGGSMAGQDAPSLAREFAAVRQLRTDVEKPVLHVSLSFDPGRADRQGDRHVPRKELARLATDYLKGMSHDLDRVQWVAIEHRDRPHQHVHLVVSRVRLDGTSLLPAPLPVRARERFTRERNAAGAPRCRAPRGVGQPRDA